MRVPQFSLFTGTSNPDLTREIARILEHRVSQSTVNRFPDGELGVRLDEPVRGYPVFIVHSTAPPVSENVFELLAFVEACRRAAAGPITAVVPYFGYARSDTRHGRREPIIASMMANLLHAVGLNHLVALDLHAAQIEGFFHLPVDHLTAVSVLCDELKSRLPADAVIVSPDEGRVPMARQYSDQLGLEIAILHKQRAGSFETRTLKVVGGVGNRPCLIIDDLISTGATLRSAIAALLEAGARPEMWLAATHGVLLPGARACLNHPAVRGIFVTDSVAPHHDGWPELHVVSIAPLLAAAIHHLATRESITDLFPRNSFTE